MKRANDLRAAMLGIVSFCSMTVGLIVIIVVMKRRQSKTKKFRRYNRAFYLRPLGQDANDDEEGDLISYNSILPLVLILHQLT